MTWLCNWIAKISAARYMRRIAAVNAEQKARIQAFGITSRMYGDE